MQLQGAFPSRIQETISGRLTMLTRGKTKQYLRPPRATFAIVCARYNEHFTDAMLRAALDTLAEAGVPLTSVKVIRVPGAFEIPVIAARLARSPKYDVIIALGCIIQGQTDHARLVAESVAHALQHIAVETNVPCIFSVVTAANEKQARERCLSKKHNRGIEAALTALEMARTQ